jgi:hypothetical protein
MEVSIRRNIDLYARYFARFELSESLESTLSALDRRSHLTELHFLVSIKFSHGV